MTSDYACGNRTYIGVQNRSDSGQRQVDVGDRFDPESTAAELERTVALQTQADGNVINRNMKVQLYRYRLCADSHDHSDTLRYSQRRYRPTFDRATPRGILTATALFAMKMIA